MKKILICLLCVLFCLGAASAAEESWLCPGCGRENGGNFCEFCGAEKPEEWLCSACGRTNRNNFCPVCGAARPVKTVYAKIDVRDYGSITVRLESQKAPVTTQNFIELAEAGFYDGLTFHRIISGFMMQGGDPLGNGTGGSGKTIVGEFSANGYDTGLKHTRGAISMARAQAYNSASSQFFIMHQDYPYLDGQYAVFGYVTEGMDVVDRIIADAKPTDGNGTIPAEAQPVIEKITVYSE